MLIKNLNEMRFDVGSMMLVDERFLIAITRLTYHAHLSWTFCRNCHFRKLKSKPFGAQSGNLTYLSKNEISPPKNACMDVKCNNWVLLVKLK